MRRVTSLFPTATEIAFAIGAGDQVVGVSHACDYPPEVEGRKTVTKPRFEPDELTSREIYVQKVETNKRFGSVYRLDETALWGLRSDVVITQGPGDFSLVSLPGVRAIAEGLNPRPELLILYPRHIDDVIDDHLRVGLAVGRMAEARDLAEGMRERIAAVEQTAAAAGRRPRVAFIQWLDPAFSGGYWIPQLIETARGRDVLNTTALSPGSFDWSELRKRRPEIVVIACEDLSIERVRTELRLLTDRPGWWELPAVRRRRVFIGDGGHFIRGGPRLIEGLEALAWAIHPDHFAEPPAEVLQPIRD